MSTRSRIHDLVFVSLGLRLAVGCLPQDTRPTPASLLVTAASDVATQRGFDTDDGWHIEFQRFLVSIGHASFTSDGACNEYSNSNYDRVLDAMRSEEQKVNLLYGLGSCRVDFRVAYPGNNGLPGAGVTDEEVRFMRTQGSDRFTTNQGMNAYVRGAARRLDQTKTFAWSFRQNWYYLGCGEPNDPGPPTGLALSGGEEVMANIEVKATELFRYALAPGERQVLFDPMALADTQSGNHDDDVSLDELSKLRAYGPSVLNAPEGTEADADADIPGGIRESVDLQSLVYQSLFPRVFRYRHDGRCWVTADRPEF